MTKDDKDYLIQSIKFIFPSINIKDSDIESSWAGLRPLIYESGKSLSEISRKDEIWQSDTGLISIAGGKLTGYRKMAETIVDKIYEQLYLENWDIFDQSKTRNLPISGGEVGGSNNLDNYIDALVNEGKKFGLTDTGCLALAKFYGSNTQIVFDYCKHDINYNIPLCLYASVMYSIDYEMITKPIDYFMRRSGTLFFDINNIEEYKDEVVNLMADVFRWTDETKIKYSNELDEEIYFSKNAIMNE
jgi:glycerol-3-phosphate dehydrogenase